MSQTSREKFLATYGAVYTAPVEKYLAQLCQQKNYSKLTEQNYRRQLAKLIKYMVSQKIDEWSQLKTIHIRQLSAFHHRNGLSPKSIALLLSACRSFFNYLIIQNKLNFNPAKGVRAPLAGLKFNLF